MGMTPEEHLAQLLDLKNSQVQQLEGEVEDLERRLRGMEQGWTEHVDLQGVKQTLPVPRLEVDINEKGTWKYRLVKGYMSYQLKAIPLGHAKNVGGYQPWPPITDGELELPSSLANTVPYDAALLNLPAFIVGCGHIQGVAPWPLCKECRQPRHPEWLENLTCYQCRQERKEEG